jgi:hypothetical protein
MWYKPACLPPTLGNAAGVFLTPSKCPDKGFEMRLRQWDYSIMKLVADDNGRLACKSLFTPKRAFSAERQADGSIRLIELVEKEVPVVRARKVNLKTAVQTTKYTKHTKDE